jgi:hypothetical protein
MALVVLGALVILKLGNASPFQKSEKSGSTGGTHWRMLCQRLAGHSNTVRPSTARAGTTARALARATAA